MDKILDNNQQALAFLINAVSKKTGLRPNIIEKDLWLCEILHHLFVKSDFNQHFVFKGGTSLSKVYKLVERFSEDVDLFVDWKLLGFTDKDFEEKRTRSSQEKFNKKVNESLLIFLETKLVPELNKAFDKYKDIEISLNKENLAILIDYPKFFKSDNGILKYVLLEVGCLAGVLPKNTYPVNSYIKESYPDLFEEEISVIATDSIRTLLEKLTILHKESNRTNGNYPKRYSRHYYDIYKMLKTDLRQKAVENLELLEEIIEHNNIFYPTTWAKNEEIMQSGIKLIPPQEAIDAFKEDYRITSGMIFGDIPPFEEILSTIAEFEVEINNAILNRQNTVKFSI